MKCINCETKIAKQDRYCHHCGFDMGDYNTPQGQRRERMGRIKWGALVLAVLVAFAILWRFVVQSDEAVVGTALVETINTLQAEGASMAEALPLVNYLLQMEEEWTANLFLDGEEDATATLSGNPTQRQYRLEYSLDDLGILGQGTLLTSNQHITIQLDGLDGMYGVDLTTLKEDMAAFSMVDLTTVATYYDYDLLQNNGEAQSQLQTLMEEAVVQLIPSIQVEKMGNQSLTIDGQEVETTGYQIIWDVAEVERVLKELGEWIVEDDLLRPYLELAVTASQQFSQSYALEDIGDIQTLWNSQVDGLVEELTSGSRQMVYLYGGRVVLLASIEDEFSQGWGLALSPQDKILDYVSLVALDGFQMAEFVAISAQLEGEVFQLEATLPYGGDFIVDYRSGDSQQNFILQYGYDILALDVELEGDSLYLGGTADGIAWCVATTLQEVADSTFDQGDYQNLLTMTMMDYLMLSQQLGIFSF